MLLRTFHVDAFTNSRFSGNPASVVVLEDPVPDSLLQTIAIENNQPATAFLRKVGEGWAIRWFTSKMELPLCGHATLASAWVVFEGLGVDQDCVTFSTQSSGDLVVKREGSGFALGFPTQPAAKIESPDLIQAISLVPGAILANESNYVVVLPSAEDVREFRPDFAKIASLDRAGLILTALDNEPYDCVSRYFAPAKGVPEDSVTGSAHCTIAPYWSQRLGKSEIRAYQASARGGEMICRTEGERVTLVGECVPYSSGHIVV
jgi:PhzF family phenazine biosynthesis protein